MPKLPEFMLRALYLKGSLQHQEDGFEFQMKNELGTARIIGVRPLLVDRRPVPLEQCLFLRGDQKASFVTVTADQSVLMRKGEATTIRVEGIKLRSGRHTLGINIIVKDLGPVSFSISDQVKSPQP